MFANTTEKGKWGEAIIGKEFHKRGLVQLKSKYGANNGIDAVFGEFDKNRRLRKLILVECKVDKGLKYYSPQQMSDKSIRQTTQKMALHDDRYIRGTATLIAKAMKRGDILKLLVHIDTKTHRKKSWALDSMGRPNEKTLRDVQSEVARRSFLRRKSINDQ